MQKKYNNFYIFYKSPKTFFITISTFLILAAWSFWDRIFLHNKWNHSDWATFLAGFQAFVELLQHYMELNGKLLEEKNRKKKKLLKLF